MKLALVATHPIQYYAPVFQLLAKEVELKVFYTNKKRKSYDPGFQQEIIWDIPLLQGYDFSFNEERPVIKNLISFDPHYLLIYGWASSAHLHILTYFKNKIPILFRGDSNLLENVPWYRSILKEYALKWVYAHVQTALYTGTNNKEYFKKYGLKESQLIFSPHAIDNMRFSIYEPSLSVRENLGIKKDDLLVLFAGKFSRNKNPILLLRAFLKANVPNTHLLFIGGGLTEGNLRNAAEYRSNIHVLPFQNQKDIPAYYKACDLFCLPSNHETWGLSINEAMACGKAVLVSDRCGAAVDLVTQYNGSVFKHQDVNDLTRKLEYFLKHPLLLEKAGRQAALDISEWNFNNQSRAIINCLYA
ncbi:glycosyltransferase involved in cell wall biosynthesis [Pedobacter sp. CAN_A7]|uniref:glycosyltransferase family 4 protein n=1 Tax=Pedobacter sp. CAN_A7 TaxID=2787722 RepID=UPI0018CAC08B